MAALLWLRSRRRRPLLNVVPAPAAPAPVQTFEPEIEPVLEQVEAQPAWDPRPFPAERHGSYCGFCGFKPDACWERWDEVPLAAQESAW